MMMFFLTIQLTYQRLQLRVLNTGLHTMVFPFGLLL